MSRVRLDIGSVVVGGGPVASVITLKPHEEVPGLGMVQLPIRIGIAEASSISAALDPADTNYYFYALDTESGVHKFFTNETEFNNFVATQNYS